MSLTDAVEAEIATLATALPALADSGTAALAVSMAQQIDSVDAPVAAKASCARVLADALKDLRDMAPAVKKEGVVDELNKRRAERRSRQSAS